MGGKIEVRHFVEYGDGDWDHPALVDFFASVGVEGLDVFWDQGLGMVTSCRHCPDVLWSGFIGGEVL